MATGGAGMTLGYVSSDVRATRCRTKPLSVALFLVVRVADLVWKKDREEGNFADEKFVTFRMRIDLQTYCEIIAINKSRSEFLRSVKRVKT